MGVSRNNANKVVQRAKILGKERKKARKEAAKKHQTQDIIYKPLPSKKHLKKLERKKTLFKKTKAMVKNELKQANEKIEDMQEIEELDAE